MQGCPSTVPPLGRLTLKRAKTFAPSLKYL